MPSPRPLRNSAAMPAGGGATAKITSAASASPISARIAAARRAGGISDTTLTPITLESA